jgi:hypothetical protein
VSQFCLLLLFCCPTLVVFSFAWFRQLGVQTSLLVIVCYWINSEDEEWLIFKSRIPLRPPSHENVISEKRSGRSFIATGGIMPVKRPIPGTLEWRNATLQLPAVHETCALHENGFHVCVVLSSLSRNWSLLHSGDPSGPSRGALPDTRYEHVPLPSGDFCSRVCEFEPPWRDCCYYVTHLCHRVEHSLSASHSEVQSSRCASGSIAFYWGKTQMEFLFYIQRVYNLRLTATSCLRLPQFLRLVSGIIQCVSELMARSQMAIFNVPQQLKQWNSLVHVKRHFKFCLHVFSTRTASYATNV